MNAPAAMGVIELSNHVHATLRFRAQNSSIQRNDDDNDSQESVVEIG